MSTTAGDESLDTATAEALLRSVERTGAFAGADWKRRYVSALFVGDAVTCFVSLAATYLAANPAALNGLGLGMLLGTLPVWLLLLGFSRAYDKACVGLGSEEFRRVGSAFLRLAALVAIIGYGLHLAIPRSLVAVALPLALVASLAQRAVLRNVLHRARSVGKAQHAVVVVGTPAAALGLVTRLADDTKGAFAISSVVASDSVDVEGVLEAVRRTGADTVAVAASSGLPATELRRLGWALETSDVDLIVTTDLVEVAGPRIHVRPVAGLPLLHVQRPELGGFGKVMKTAFDRTAAGLALVVLAPVLALIAVLIRRDSKGGAIFRQTRVGKDGREFTVLKFRTMRQGADLEVAQLAMQNESDGVLFKMKNDPRITKVGSTLRKLSLDELPQLWNVVRGDMSIVGPRPPLPTEVAKYESDVHRRLLVKPGITGLWQVSGRSDLSWDQTVRLDLSYVENWSFVTDLAIIMRTAGAVLRSRGAY